MEFLGAAVVLIAVALLDKATRPNPNGLSRREANRAWKRDRRIAVEKLAAEKRAQEALDAKRAAMTPAERAQADMEAYHRANCFYNPLA